MAGEIWCNQTAPCDAHVRMAALQATQSVGATMSVSGQSRRLQMWRTRPHYPRLCCKSRQPKSVELEFETSHLQEKWGQPVIVENRAGGDGIVAISAFIAATDNHTLLFTPTSAFIAHPYEYAKIPYIRMLSRRSRESPARYPRFQSQRPWERRPLANSPNAPLPSQANSTGSRRPASTTWSSRAI